MIPIKEKTGWVKCPTCGFAIETLKSKDRPLSKDQQWKPQTKKKKS